MGKVKDNHWLCTSLENELADLENLVKSMEEKRGSLFIRWLKTQTRYLGFEKKFDPKRLIGYRRGDIVYIEYGFNIGSEHGGPHWGVVMENSHKKSPTILIIPLGSLEHNEEESSLHPRTAFLGVVEDINKKRSYAIPNQIRSISKMRIIKPKKSDDKKYRISNEQMDIIDEKLFSWLFERLKLDYTQVVGLATAIKLGEVAATTELPKMLDSK